MGLLETRLELLPAPQRAQPQRLKRLAQVVVLASVAALLFYGSAVVRMLSDAAAAAPASAPAADAGAERLCRMRNARAGAPPNFSSRARNDRYVDSTAPIVIRNATLWTGEKIRHAVDIHIDHGLIVDVTDEGAKRAPSHAEVIHAHGAWVTPGLIDLHAHLGVYPTPTFDATLDLNSFMGPTQPQLRSIDGFNEHDDALRLTAAGGITSALILPGSLNNIGGQAFPIKLGKHRGGPSERVIDPPRALVLPSEGNVGRDSLFDTHSGMERPDESTSFRHIKMACGENARYYKINRLDEAWNFRKSFERARRLVEEQDAFCDSLEKGTAAGPYPTDLEVEVLADAIRGHVKIHTHCYTMTDIDALIRHSNEFRFPIASLHHAHEAYLVPQIIRGAYNGTPVVAMFSANANYKYESYFGSPFAGEILRRHNITPVYKSDHPVTDSRRLLVQAAQAHHYGLPEEDALRAVTSAPAHALGLAHRIGHVSKGHDADIVLWDRHPLQLGATPVQIIIDGVTQLDAVAHVDAQGPTMAPKSADYAAEIDRVASSASEIASSQAHAYPSVVGTLDSVVLKNVSTVYRRVRDRIVEEKYEDGIAIFARGTAVCVGESIRCVHAIPADATNITLNGGTLTPGVIAYSSAATLGLSDVPSERIASDGKLPSPSRADALDPDALGARLVPRAADGLSWGGNDLLRAHASGVSTAVTAPHFAGEFAGVSVQFDTGADHILQPHAIRQSEVALHVALKHGTTPLSAQIQLLRAVLSAAHAALRSDNPRVDSAWLKVARGNIPLVVKAESVAQMAQVIAMQRDFRSVRIVIDTAGPAHLLAPELAASGTGVLVPLRKWFTNWDTHGSLPGAPLSNSTDIGVLRAHGVRVGASIDEPWEATNLVWEATWALMDANATTAADGASVLELLTTNIETLLGLPASPPGDFVAYDGSPFTYGTKVVAAGTPRGIELFP
ncbi:hypothetical protein MCUN1_001422 [Malassezia cuniculi]|uniref:Amidohydrolase-related domain-containing protein n=1 Tax=Malassezia cuniculi TaxID=948313 RepID=A0AAF0EQ86_9BASI|nr:hypothetical protein MCUN1_001422 [Malassezia cuniculi]